jgi:hypothetical protein
MISAALRPDAARASTLARRAPLESAQRSLFTRGQALLEREVAARDGA